MVELICQKDPTLVLDKRELNRNTPSYTVETLREIKEQYNNAQLFFIMGMDSLLGFNNWYKYQEILTLSHLAINTRPNYHIDKNNIELITLLANHQINHPNELRQKKAGCILLNNAEDWNISSTDIREKLKKQHDCRDLLPKAIISYINKEQLYR